MVYVLGINEILHDTAVALLDENKVIALMEEERLTRIKQISGFLLGGGAPKMSIDWCLETYGLRDSDIDAVGISFDVNFLQVLKMLYDTIWQSILKTPLGLTMRNRFTEKDVGMELLNAAIPSYLFSRRNFLKELRTRFKRVFFFNHHLCHAASAFHVSGFDDAGIIVADGLSEDTPTSLWHGHDSKLRAIRKYPSFQSLGKIYRTVSGVLGFFNFEVGKTMGLSAYGEYDTRFEDILEIKDGDYRVNLLALRKLAKYARRGNDPIDQVHKNIAATLQELLERAGCELAKAVHKETGCKNICLAGGVALNCPMNRRILDLPFVENIFIQPGAMDMGSSLGAAVLALEKLGYDFEEEMRHCFYGNEYINEGIEPALKGMIYEKRDDVVSIAARALARNKIIGWFQGRMEFGPRALGTRSILASPATPDMKDRVNVVKTRALWRPLAPSVLEEDLPDWFEDPFPSPFMTLNFRFKDGMGDKVPSVRHVDGSARVQTIAKDLPGRYRELIAKFKELTGIPMVLNTSFNEKGDPIVCYPKDAVKSFLNTDMDFLFIGDFVVAKSREALDRLLEQD
ncbi:MAG: hypothetical protein JW941_06800 [Candidatus Coatesbacteria bacterium]|nr:hypothetical protein [Candidatus Coatesbacteria bacterium]